jgi:hypothetical protein
MLLGRLGLGQVGRREFYCRFRLTAQVLPPGVESCEIHAQQHSS